MIMGLIIIRREDIYMNVHELRDWVFWILVTIMTFMIMFGDVSENRKLEKEAEEEVKRMKSLKEYLEKEIGSYIIELEKHDRFVCEAREGRFLVIHKNFEFIEIVPLQNKYDTKEGLSV